MADKKITELTNITGADLVDADEFVVVDISADETKAITLSELKEAFDSGSGFVRITGDTMTGALDVQSTITADGLTVDGDVAISSDLPSITLTDNNNASSRADIEYNFGYLSIDADANSVDVAEAIDLKIGGTLHFRLGTGGDISFYEDTGTTPKFFWDASAESLGIGTSSPDTPLHILGASDVVSTIESTDRYSHVDFVDSLGSSRITNDGGNLRLRADNANAVASSYLTLETDGSERMRIDSSGNVGIGTSSPSDALHVYNTSGLNHIRIDGPSGINRNLNFSTSGSNRWNIYANSTAEGGSNSGSNLTIAKYTDAGAYNGVAMFIERSSGNVGIGNTSPSSYNSGSRTLVIGDGGTEGISIHAGTGMLHFTNGADTTERVSIKSTVASNTLEFTTGGSEAMRIDSSGNVGIGTSSPSTIAHLHGVAPVLTVKDSRSKTWVSGESLGGINFDSSDASNSTTTQAKIEIITDDGSSGTYAAMAFSTSTPQAISEAMRISSSGRVGISTSTPATTLDVDGTTTSNQYLIDAISDTISDTAVDIFVYDTRKDSDGGAWRKRTQGTSWYNETLNTSTRGSRKEFPSVAVIVLRTNAVTIYDGDDPDLPMWWYGMSTNMGGFGMNGAQSVSMLNGLMIIGQNDTSGSNYDGLRVLDFIRDYGYWTWYNGNGSLYEGTLLSSSGGVTNNNQYYPFLIKSGNLVATTINDVAMTVLPNAPIDAATGLPVPTIAVATEGGVSVIKDDGTVVDSSNTNTYGTIDFYGDNFLVARNTSAGGIWTFHDYSSDSFVTFKQYNQTSTPPYIGAGTSGAVGTKGNNFVKFRNASNGVQTMIAENVTAASDGMAHFFTSDYATGWMNGDIKLATLSDTDDTNVTGSELVTNGTFDSDVSGWSAGLSSTLTYSSGVARLQLTGGSSGEYTKARTSLGTLTSGKKYTVSIGSFTRVSGNALRIRINTDGGVSTDGQPSGSLQYNSTSDITNFSFTYEATSTAEHFLWMHMQDFSGDSEATFDNISVRLAEEDRSVNGKGLQVFGTVTKTPVATGADLVAYSGFSGSDYLEQPYNSDLDFGTGSFSIMYWVKTSDLYYTVVDRNDGEGFGLYTTGTSPNSRLRLIIGSTVIDSADTTRLTTDTWTQIVVLRRSSTSVEYYINGTLLDTNTISSSLSASSPSELPTRVGVRSDGAQNMTGSMALLRISATAPSPEQIKKIYEDEKVLFQENAQATLYGSSDAVTALAYDDSTNILSVGTSAGRSDFQGLRRVNNTTNAVGAAISASNGMIVEE